MPQRFYAPHFSRLPPPIYSLPHKSHDPSVNYRTTQAGRGKNLKTPSVSLIGAWPPPSPPHSFVFAVKTQFQSFLEMAADVWHQYILLGIEMNAGQILMAKGSISHMSLLYVRYMRWTD